MRSALCEHRAAWLTALLCGCVSLPLSMAGAAVPVVEGPTLIDKGSATAAGDITVVNENLAFALAVQSAVPYGVARGALVDLAPVTNGRVGRDRVVFADFIPDNWSAWPNTFHRVDILERGPHRAVIRTERDWGSVDIVTVYTLLADADHVDIEITMTNGGATLIVNILSGFTLWPNSGFCFGVPGMQGVTEGDAALALAHRVVAYDQDWAAALHADYFDRIGDGARDLYLRHTLSPGESRRFEGWLQVRPSGDLAPVIAADIDRGRLTSAACTVPSAVTTASRSNNRLSSSNCTASLMAEPWTAPATIS